MSEETKPKTLSESVILEWTGDNIKHVPENIVLNTGTNEVPRKSWEASRWMVEDLIAKNPTEAERKEGRIIEHGIDATTEQVPEKKGPGGKVIEEAKTITKIKAAKGLADYDQEKAIELVQACNNLKDLKSWSKAEVRPGVAVAIKDQIEKIEKAEGEGED